MMENFRSQKGLTLIEVLLSTVLLAIILISFLGFFTQTATFNQRNGQRLDMVQTSQKYINLVKENVSASNLPSTLIGVSIDKPTLDNIIKNSNSSIDPSTFFTPYDVKGIATNDDNNLVKFKITVSDKSNTNIKTATYTYLRK